VGLSAAFKHLPFVGLEEFRQKPYFVFRYFGWQLLHLHIFQVFFALPHLIANGTR